MRLLCSLVLLAAADSQPWEQKEFDCDRPAHGCDETKCCEYGLAVYTREKPGVDVKEVKGKPGHYRAVAYLRPHFQLEALDTSMRLVADLPPPPK